MKQGRSLFVPPPDEEPAGAPPRAPDGGVARQSSVLFHDDGRDDQGTDRPGNAAGAKTEAGARAPRATRHWRLAVASALVGAAAVTLAVVAVPRFIAPPGSAPAPAATTGTLVIEAAAAGWHVWDGGVDRGATPLTLALPTGRHALVLRRGTMSRRLEVDLAAGARVVHHLDLPEAPPSGDLHVATVPPGAIVVVDGVGRGQSPIDVRDLKAGRHVVTLLNGDRVMSQSVTVDPGSTASLVVPLAASSTAAVGWVAVASDIELEVFEGDSLVGSSRNQRVLFVPGRHVLRLLNRDLGFEITKTVQVQPGAMARVQVQLPTGSLSVNAVPWAEVLMDGSKIGDTPIANFPAPIGSHEVVLRHPKFGEQRRSVVVSLTSPVRLGVDLRQ